ncbi:uncharacterized protein LOC128546604 [Mercenaria mercenaria]|uniref:uncharacterized protein LOC128546604 n=1 Tax=Mercenaria mercenaria TaxID=6596 RepID=UPI00234EFA5E|nr:uncharacterized protein LOC128546604 [Mercenaria mercenaria]
MFGQSARALTVLSLVVVTELIIASDPVPDPVPNGQCAKIDECSCKYDNGAVVNLHALDRKDGKPKFSNETNTAGNEYYSWNPCSPFSYYSNYSSYHRFYCQNVSVCMIRQGIPRELFYDLGYQGTARFWVDGNGTLKLTYTVDQGDFKSETEITLRCLTNSNVDSLTAYGEQAKTNDVVLYKLELASKYACAYATTSIATRTSTASSNSPSLIGSAWTTICQVLLVLIYVRAGMLCG